MEPYEKLEKLVELLGYEEIITNVKNYFSYDDLNDFCESIISENDLEDEFND